MTEDNISFHQIVAEAGKLCRQKSTGTLFITTKAHKSAQMVLDKGEITYLLFSGKRGLDALTLMSTIDAGKFRFQEGGVIPPRMALPPSESILETLVRGTAAPASSGGGARTGAAAGLSSDQKEVLQSCLAECIGPMAMLICEDNFESGKPFAEVVDALAAEIPSSDQAKRFRELVAASSAHSK
jgi:hypothetical protein